MSAAQTSDPRESFSALLARLHLEQHTGAVILHFGQGVPSRVEFVKSTVIVLDNAKN